MADVSAKLKEAFQSGPVTALKIIGDTVLAGIGCYLHIYDLITTRRLQSTKVLPHQNIHGIEKDHTTTTTTPTEGFLCIYGEKILNIVSYSGKRITEEHRSREFQDWIWDVRWLTNTDQCPNSNLAITLGHNVIVQWNWTADQLLNYVHCQEQCILYSAHFIGVSWNQLLLASGTVFNQVVVWSPVVNTTVDHSGQTFSKPLQYFTGHQGVIFSIHYHQHQQLMCSVSDDRSIRVWKLTFQGKNAPESIWPEDWAMATSEIVHVLYGHSARVWRARLLTTGIISIGEDAACCIWNAEGQIIQKFKGHKGKSIWSLAIDEEETIAVTGGGDCSIRVWNIGNVEENCKTISKTHLKLDKSILPHTSNQEDFPRSVTYLNFNTVLINANSGLLFMYCLSHLKWRVIGGDDTFLSYSCLAVSHDTQSIAMGNLYGSVVVILPTGDLDPKQLCHCNTNFLTSQPFYISVVGKIYSIHWLTDTQILVSEHTGTLSVWKLHRSSLMPTLAKLQEFCLPPCKHRWITAACLLPGDLQMVCGDRNGSLYVYPFGKSTDQLCHPEQRFPKLHGKAGVTDVCYHNNYLYTAGRDGRYRQYTVTEDGSLKLVNNNKIYKGFDWFEKLLFGDELLLFGFHSVNFILWNCSKSEKLLEIPCGGGHRSWSCLLRNDLVHFVYIKVQDIVICRASIRPTLVLKQSHHGRQMLDIKHISSTLTRHSDVSHHFCISCSEDTSLQLFHLNFKHSGAPNTTTTDMKTLATLQAHISSVRCLTVLPSTGSSLHPSTLDAEAFLVISGGGRAQLNVWRFIVNSTSDRKEEKVVSEEEETETEDGDKTEFNYIHEHLCSEFLVKRPPKLWKSRLLTLDPEMRILSLTAFHGHQINTSVENGFVFVAAACSDGTLRLFCFDERQHNRNGSNKNNRNSSQLHSVWQQQCHGGSCVLQVSHILYECSTSGVPGANRTLVVLVSAATDGHLAFWDITAICKGHLHQLLNQPHCSHPSRDFAETSVNSNTSEHCFKSSSIRTIEEDSDPLDRQTQTLMGNASSGFSQCNEDGGGDIDDEEEEAHCNSIDDDADDDCLIYKTSAHQSGVNSLHLLQQQDSSFLLASGGDDNALFVMKFAISLMEDRTDIVCERSVSHCSAHAAQITGVWFVNSTYLVSSSVDQRICVWQLLFGEEIAQIKYVISQFVTIADLSNIDVWQHRKRIFIAVCGTGMSLLTLELPTPST
ncbi:WD repeat-containing protein 6 [Octopus sinensis]|uniref:tRNA (34-2'-O)-methyltransferase regulator WDR6 n=1 Tax=Octopus sinensis TaxID=2607531 RepID=A0A6P7T3G8_9MOLL|nr:WD repeat-containing protein 6 [Octopus sinensis]XP_036364598.1 WD repeat-containing protein 6 [Octopus sinensis]